MHLLICLVMLGCPVQRNHTPHQGFPDHWTVHCRKAPHFDGSFYSKPTKEAAESYCSYWEDWQRKIK